MYTFTNHALPPAYIHMTGLVELIKLHITLAGAFFQRIRKVKENKKEKVKLFYPKKMFMSVSFTVYMLNLNRTKLQPYTRNNRNLYLVTL